MRRRTTKKTAPLVEELEQRLLLSADVQGLLIDPNLMIDQQATDPAPHVLLANDGDSQEAEVTAAVHPRREIAFIDAGVDDHQSLVDQLLANDLEGRQLDVFVLDTGTDGIEQISTILGAYEEVDAIHIISHGVAGGVQLGSTELDAENLATYASDIAAWGDTLTLDADLLLYGCDLAGSEEGEAFLTSISELTGADVAASVDATGNAEKGGDWDLEYRVGEVEDSLAVANYDGLLAAATIITTGDATVAANTVFTLNLDGSDLGDPSITGWTINWGDGEIDTIVGNPSTATHTYTQAGFTYNITASATDEAGVHLQNNLIVAGYKTGSLFLYENTTGSYLDEFDTGTGLDSPFDVVIGPDGDVYASGWKSSTVHKFDPTTGADLGEFISVGDGGLTAWSASGIAFGPDGNLYLADYNADKILKFNGTTGDFISTFVDMSGEVGGPAGIVFGPNGDLYVGGYDSDNVYKYDGTTGVRIGSGALVTAASGYVTNVNGMTFGPDGNLYVSSAFDDEVYRFNPTTGALVAGPSANAFVRAADNGGLGWTEGLSFGPDGNLYVGSYDTDEVLRFDGTTGAFIDVYADSTTGNLDQTMGFDWVPGHQVTILADTVGAVTDSNVSANSVSESASNGTAVGITAAATDPNDSVTYSLDDDAGGRFAIDTSTGIVTVANTSLLDAETSTSHNITVKATSADTSTSTAVMAITISDDTSESTIGATTDSDGTANSVVENAGNGTAVGITALATDADVSDDTTYSLDDNAGGRFAIDATTGVVTVLDRSLLDFEAATSHNITVRATSDDGSLDTAVMTINILNDATEIFTTGANTAEAGQVYTLNLDASELGDPSITGWTINWGDGTIDTIVGNPATATHTYTQAGFTYNITVSATDEGGTHLQNNLIVASNKTDSLVLYENTTGSFLDEFDTGTGLDYPVDMVIGPDGLVYISGNTSGTIHRFNATTGAHVDEFVSSGTGGLTAADGIAFGPDGHLYVADYDSNKVLKFDSATGASLGDFVDGGGDGVDGSSGMTFGPDGNLYIASYDGNTVHKYDGTTGALIGGGAFVTAGLGGLDAPEQITFGPSGDLYVASGGTSEVFRYDGTTGALVGGGPFVDAADNGTLDWTTGLAFGPDGNLYVGSWWSDEVLRFDGTTGAYMDVYADSSGASPLDEVMWFAFVPGHQVTVVDNVASAISDSNASANQVGENAANGTAVGITALATDADAGDDISYSLDDDAGGRFAIDSSTGVVTVLDNSLLDYESATSHDITVRATSDDTSYSTAVMTVSLLDDTSEFSIGATTDDDGTANTVIETAANGTTVGITALATDGDGSDDITYTLDDDDGGRFAIDSSTGVVTVLDNSLLDYESATSHDITVRATSDDASFSTAVMTINLSDDTSEFSTGSVTDNDGTSNLVSESASNGTAVGITALATDSDATDDITYSLDDNASGRFTIDSSTGVVSILDNSLLDYETATSHDITVRATSDDASFSTAVMTINLSDDTSEFSAGSVTDNDGTSNLVSESAANGAAVGITALATDGDATDDITYSLDNNAGGRFAIDATTGVITVFNNNLLDYETTTSHDITVRATSDDTSTTTQAMTINLSDDTSEFSASAITDQDATADELSESAADGSAVGITALATDGDSTDNITYSLDDDAGGRFAIDATTGVITAVDSSMLDYEATTSHDITVKATSTDTTTTTQTMTINLWDDTSESSVSAISDDDAAQSYISAGAANGSVVGITTLAIDGDATDTITYTMDDNAGGRFEINATTGVITVMDNSLFDYQTQSSHDVTVRAWSSDGSNVAQIFTIGLLDPQEIFVPIPDEEPSEDEEEDEAENETTEETETEIEFPVEEEPPGPASTEVALNPDLTRFVDPREAAVVESETVQYDLLQIDPDGIRATATQAPTTMNSQPDTHSVERAEAEAPNPAEALQTQQAMRSALETLSDDVTADLNEHEEKTELTIASVEGTALVVSTSLLAIISRASSLVAAAISSVPIWGRVDPLAVLALSPKEREKRRVRLRKDEELEAEESRDVSSLIDGEAPEDADDEKPES